MICPACTDGDHSACPIWTCECLHDDPDQLTIDDALEDA